VLREDGHQYQLGERVAHRVAVVERHRVGSGGHRILEVHSVGRPVGGRAILDFTSVLNVQATSLAVSGWPSDHLAPETRWKVHVRPSEDDCHDLAKYGTMLLWASYSPR
jgi:hypothetical protein